MSRHDMKELGWLVAAMTIGYAGNAFARMHLSSNLPVGVAVIITAWTAAAAILWWRILRLSNGRAG